MKLNSNTMLVGQKTVLVPYREHHVPKYHKWMQNEDLQMLTASEPLSLEEEYQMQRSWQEDDNKCTFIILDKSSYEENNDEIAAMVGDTNIFLLDQDFKSGEIEIMIAEEAARGKKLGWEAVILMLLYGINQIKIETYEAKISLVNKISIKMFLKLGFEEKSKSEVFQEVTLKKQVSEEWKEWLGNLYTYEIKNCA